MLMTEDTYHVGLYVHRIFQHTVESLAHHRAYLGIALLQIVGMTGATHKVRVQGTTLGRTLHKAGRWEQDTQHLLLLLAGHQTAKGRIVDTASVLNAHAHLYDRCIVKLADRRHLLLRHKG